MGELSSDDAATHNRHRLRQLLHPQNVLVGVVGNAAIGDNTRDHRTSAGCEDNTISTNRLGGISLGCAQKLISHKVRGSVVDINVGALVATSVRFATLGNGVDTLIEYAADNGRPIHTLELSLHTVGGGFFRCVSDVGGIDVHLGGNAANIEASTSESALLYDRDLLIGKFITGNGVT